MTVFEDGNAIYSWSVSTARKGYRTPTGSYRPIRMHKMWYSRKYDMSPMPYSIFFYGGYAIHGTDAVKSLGRPASHGCIRLHPSNAKTLYNLVKEHGAGNTRIVLVR
jgi:lipoprotein-anchoring transpeptidase ErfK/SrfK